nr:dihydropteroate synthase [Catenuloplanes japonicus]
MSSFFEPEIVKPVRRIGAREFDFSRQVAVMAIVNRTPDSFFDRGRTYALRAAVDAVLAAAADGADWIDIGGVPFGPGPEVTEAEELDRVIPVVEAVRAASDVVISVDTYRTGVARAAIDAGADVINDTSGLQDDALASLVAASQAALVITHSLASPPRTPHPRPAYQDVAREIAAFLGERAARAVALGVPPERIIIDPGHDLNKNTRHTLELTRRLSEITSIGYPTLAAVSNKDFIGETLDLPAGLRLPGTLAAVVLSIVQGARIVRVHDVPAAVSAVRLTEAVLGWREPAYTRHNV